jgi:hypothetical protein
MKTSDIIASTGVIILLIAFVLNLYKRISPTGRPYAVLNFAGAATCCYASYMINFYPFVVLEAIWAGFAVISFIKVPRGTLNDIG